MCVYIYIYIHIFKCDVTLLKVWHYSIVYTFASVTGFFLRCDITQSSTHFQV